MVKWLRFWVLAVATFALAVGLLSRHPSVGYAYVPPDQTIGLGSSTGMELAYEASALEPFETLIANSDRQDGLFPLYRDRETGITYLEVRPDQLDHPFLSVMTLEAGLGELGLYRGMPVNTFLFQFRRVNNAIQIVVPNLNFRADQPTPQAPPVRQSFSDSVLYTVPIHSIHPTTNSVLIDASELLTKNDLADVSRQFYWVLTQGYSFNAGLSYLGDVNAFPKNVELDAVYGFSGAPNPSNNSFYLDSLPDQRGFQITVRYSFSELPEANGYRPRLADDRVGYFITAYQDLSNPRTADPFVRYINRWNLQPLDPSLPVSPPKQPLVYWIENTVPTEYRQTIQDGILMWNQAFERAGLLGAIEVKQMPDDADWDPADVRYNTIRWSPTFEAGLMGIGPVRVNPLTGEILDADILINANAIRLLEQNTAVWLDNQQAQGTAATVPFCSRGLDALYVQWQQAKTGRLEPGRDRSRSPHALMGQEGCYGTEAQHQLSMGKLALAVLQNTLPSSDASKDYIHQFLRQLVAHEVGHTLGLRHNFRGSTMLSLDQLNDPTVTRDRGLTGSVMDYLPVNLAPIGTPQGDYFSTVVGPYDQWAIEYGYRALDAATPQAERRQLEQLAQQVAEPGYGYATDEDATDSSDPAANPWDLSSDMMGFAQQQMDTTRQVWDRLPQRYPLPGESYSQLRDRFEVVFYNYFNNALNLTRYIGGRVFNRDRYGDPGGRQPFEPIPIEQQQQALETLNRYVFSKDVFVFPPSLLNQLAPSRWYHWGSYPNYYRLDYPIYDDVLFLQSLVLSDVLSSDRLARLRDGELRAPNPASLTIPDVFESVQTAIWQEIQPDSTDTTISSLRRGLQRQYLDVLSHMVLRDNDAIYTASNFTDFIVALRTLDAPDDAQIMARYQLRQLDDTIARHMRRHDDLDRLTQAHLEDVRDRIAKVLDATLQSS